MQKEEARLFNCVRCHQQTLICSCCDRGNIYCSAKCSQAARKGSVLAAGRRYQNSLKGRLKHAARQRRYRERKKECTYLKNEKVTHQGSPIPSANDLLPPECDKPAIGALSTQMNQNRCHFCHKHCSDFVRLGFLQSRASLQTQRKTSWPLGP